ncbi:MAG: ATP-dependent serine protease [Bacteroidota bacterium]|jgi:molybdopterin-guanine dinucleotide biosynthesis protein
MTIKRALTLKNIVNATVRKFEFAGEWEKAFGSPESTGVWYIFGNSGSGKTSFILMLIKCLSAYGRVLFVSYEEGEISASLQEGIDRFGLLERNSDVHVCTDNLEELTERLNKRRSADFVIIDSLEYSEFATIKRLKAFTEEWPDKLFVFIGQAEGDRPRTELGKSVLFLAKQKIYIEGYRAFSRGRSFGEKGFIDIWADRAEEYWGYK